MVWVVKQDRAIGKIGKCLLEKMGPEMALSFLYAFPSVIINSKVNLLLQISSQLYFDHLLVEVRFT